MLDMACKALQLTTVWRGHWASSHWTPQQAMLSVGVPLIVSQSKGLAGGQL